MKTTCRVEMSIKFSVEQQIGVCFFLPFLISHLIPIISQTKQDTGNGTFKDDHAMAGVRMNWRVRCKMVKAFYRSLFVKFFANLVSFIGFLALYCFVILTNFEMKPQPSEYFLQFWVLTLILEEIRQVLTQDQKSFSQKLSSYFSRLWNVADTFSMIIFVVAIIMRYVAWGTRNGYLLTGARVLLATDAIAFFTRSFQIFSASQHLGPKLVMIRKMLKDVLYFIIILGVFVLGYGVAMQAVRFPNSSPSQAIVGVMNKPYWQMYGELSIDTILGFFAVKKTLQEIEILARSVYGIFLFPP